MAANPRMLITDTDVPWDGGVTHVLRGTVIDIPEGSSLEAAYGGPGNLADLTDQEAVSIGAGGAVV